MNKVLCLTEENQRKGNMTPYEYFGESKRWRALQAFCSKLPKPKTERLLMENYDEDKAKKWKERALNDTRYMSRALKNHLENHLDLGESNRIQTRNGALTANLRSSWGFPLKNRENDRHHAVDAIVVACSTQSMVQKFSNWNRTEAWKRNPSERPIPPKPWDSFRDDVMDCVFGQKNEKNQREGGIFVSRMPVRKITGAAHEETIRSIRQTPEGRKIVQRVKLGSLKLSMLENLVDKDRNIKLYNVLKERLEQFGDDAKKAFAEPVHMPVNDPSKTAPQINSVQIVTTEKSGIPINEGLASNGDMIRVDVFRKNNKFFLVPIYVHHFVQEELPNKAIVAFKDEIDWQEMNENDFLFSLYRNDYVKIKTKKEEIEGYYVGVDRSTGAVGLKSHDNDPNFGKKGLLRIGIKGALTFTKYTVDYFGNLHIAEKEERRGVEKHNDPESGEIVAS